MNAPTIEEVLEAQRAVGAVATVEHATRMLNAYGSDVLRAVRSAAAELAEDAAWTRQEAAHQAAGGTPRARRW